jgi:VIT1/CCC1 family predicted Fe2+/Mn2+ transporter
VTAPVVAPRPGRLGRWRLTEPVRLYVYGWSLLGVLFLVVPAAFAPNDHTLTAVIVAAVFLTWQAVGVEAARRSVFSPVGLLRARAESDAPTR